MHELMGRKERFFRNVRILFAIELSIQLLDLPSIVGLCCLIFCHVPNRTMGKKSGL